MPFAPDHHHRPASPALPRLPLPAILSFAVAGFGGALFLAYSSFSSPETTYALASAKEVPVYAARAVPKESSPEDIAQRTVSIARALTATASESHRSAVSEAPGQEGQTATNPTLLADGDRELRGFSRFTNVGVANSYLALTGTTFGMSSQMAPSEFSAADAETVLSAPVPEASTWLCGAALIALVAVRGLHATWHRNQRRESSKSDSSN